MMLPNADRGAITGIEDKFTRTLEKKNYELTDHLGNVRSVITDMKLPDGYDKFLPEATTRNYYYPFGMERPLMTASTGTQSYRYGYNGMEKDNAVSPNGVTGANYSTDFREIDTRIGRWWSRDPIVKPWESPYVTFGDNPIAFADPSGLDPVGGDNKGGGGDNSKGGNGGESNIGAGPSLSNFTSFLPGNSINDMLQKGFKIDNLARQKQQWIDEIYRENGLVNVLPGRSKLASNSSVDNFLWWLWDVYTSPINYDILAGDFLGTRTYSFGYQNRFRGLVDDDGYLHENTVEFQGDPNNPDVMYAGRVPWKLSRGFLKQFEGKKVFGNDVAHSFAKHVGKTVNFLVNRVKNEGIPRAFSFYNAFVADYAALSTYLQNQAAIKSWIATSVDGATKEFTATFPFAIGRVVKAGSTVATKAYTLTISLERNSNEAMKFIIGTVKGR